MKIKCSDIKLCGSYSEGGAFMPADKTQRLVIDPLRAVSFHTNMNELGEKALPPIQGKPREI